MAMFDEDSFQDEIETPADARSCTHYLALNEPIFIRELQNEGKSADEVQAELARVWGNLAQSAKRVGYASAILTAKAKQYT